MRLSKFRITNYRNILDSGWITTTNITAFAGQNEAGKSNLFEALYCLNPYVEGATYNDAEDWPVDDWKGRKESKGKLVCHAFFALDAADIQSLFAFASFTTEIQEGDGVEEPAVAPEIDLPENLDLQVYRHFEYATGFWSAPTEWSDVNVSAWSASGLSGRCFRAPVDDIPEHCVA